MRLGAQLSAASGFENVVADAARAGFSALQLFSRNPVGGQGRSLPPPGVLSCCLQEAGIRPLLIHAPYFVNPAAEHTPMVLRARRVLGEEMQRAYTLGA